MAKQIVLRAGPVEAVAELNETATARAIWAILPVSSEANLWGEEIYFTIPLHRELENGQALVNTGDLGYWPEGDAFCIFFGRTPVSGPGEVRPASPVTVFGRVRGDASVFRRVPDGTEITVARVNPG